MRLPGSKEMKGVSYWKENTFILVNHYSYNCQRKKVGTEGCIFLLAKAPILLSK